MIQLVHHESSSKRAGQSSLGLDSGGRVELARKGPSRIVLAIERFIAQRPRFCLGAALSVGIALGWWVKR